MNRYTYYRGVTNCRRVVDANTLNQADNILESQGLDLTKWNIGIAERLEK